MATAIYVILRDLVSSSRKWADMLCKILQGSQVVLVSCLQNDGYMAVFNTHQTCSPQPRVSNASLSFMMDTPPTASHARPPPCSLESTFPSGGLMPAWYYTREGIERENTSYESRESRGYGRTDVSPPVSNYIKKRCNGIFSHYILASAMRRVMLVLPSGMHAPHAHEYS